MSFRRAERKKARLRGEIVGAPRVVGEDPDRWMEIEWERGHFRD